MNYNILLHGNDLKFTKSIYLLYTITRFMYCIEMYDICNCNLKSFVTKIIQGTIWIT